MRIAILSDIHANTAAMEAVLEDIEGRNVERFWCLGDVIGYGPQPVLPILWLKHYVNEDDWVLGNHEAILAGLLAPAKQAEVNGSALKAVTLNGEALAADEEADDFWREAFTEERLHPRRHQFDGMKHVLVHASLHDNIFRYLYPWQVDVFLPREFTLLQEHFTAAGRPCVQWVGHSHAPMLVQAYPQEDGFRFDVEKVVPGRSYLLDAPLALVNPGSVGQPRDLNRRAAYAIFDSHTRKVIFYRVPYRWRSVYQDMMSKGYPEGSARRLWDPYPASSTPQSWRDHYTAVAEGLAEDLA